MISPSFPSTEAAVAAFASTALISVAPNIMLFLFPHYASGQGQHSSMLSLGQAVAAGGLLGDVFLHVIPHAATHVSKDGGHDSSHNPVGLWILLGFTFFWITDIIIRQLSRSSGHTHSDINNKSQEHSHPLHHNPKQSLVLLNLAADALHNFTDGIAIGASYASHSTMSKTGIVSSTTTTNNTFDAAWHLMKTRGGLATLSILFHEIPHELGDFAILVQHGGFSKSQAILAQFGTAIAAMLGTYVGLIMAYTIGEELLWITAGGFVYLATVQILPELLQDEKHHSWNFRFLQVLFFVIGIGFLYAVSLLEEMDHDHDGGSGHKHNHCPCHGNEPVMHEATANDHEHHHDHHEHHHDHHDHGEL